jgi:NAD(P)-dependent dehydrogenase (short-subunit alcohol dehydrogenase family)
VDILVNNAGVAASAPLRSVSPEEWDRLFAVNVRGTYLCTREFLPDMLAEGWGRVINVASIAGLTGAAYISAYAASKHAVIGFTRSVAAEVAAKGVTVNAVCPGYVDTPMTDGSVAHIAAKTGLSPEEARERLRRMSPQNRLFEPEEVAYLVRCLADPRARGVNGQAIVLDGGALLA